MRLCRRRIYDVVDLDAWLDDCKSRGRARKEKSLWPEKKASTDAKTRHPGGSTASSRMDAAYAKALGFESERRQTNI